MFDQHNPRTSYTREYEVNQGIKLIKTLAKAWAPLYSGHLFMRSHYSGDSDYGPGPGLHALYHRPSWWYPRQEIVAFQPNIWAFVLSDHARLDDLKVHVHDLMTHLGRSIDIQLT
jgi:hypothetical protein